MNFIGIISNAKNEKILKKEITEKLGEGNKCIIINSNNIDNLKNVSFLTIIIDDNANVINEKKDIINKMLYKIKYLVINADVEIQLNISQDIKINIISYGFNSNATITASSVEDDILVCVQKTIMDVYNNMIEQQELKVNLMQNNIGINTNNLLAISSLLILHGKISQKN